MTDTTGPSLSVAMCTHNGEQYLMEQLLSIRNQTRRPDELVICDDASTDATLHLAETFSTDSPFPVRIVRNETRLGSTKNFEKVISLCRSEFIALADQDDVWYPEKLAELSAALNAGADLVFSDADVVDASLRQKGYRLWQTVLYGRQERRRLRTGRGFDVLLRRNVVTGATMAFRSRHVGMVRPIPEDWVHDGWIALQIAAVGRVVDVPRSLIAYRQHGRNQIGATRHRTSLGVKSILQARTDLLSTILAQYEQALRFQASHPSWFDAESIGKLRHKVAHHQVRIAARRGDPSLGMRVLVREFLSGRYHRYGRGALSFFKDSAVYWRHSLSRLWTRVFTRRS